MDAGSSDGQDIEDPESPGSAMFPARGTIARDMGVYGGPADSPVGISDPGRCRVGWRRGSPRNAFPGASHRRGATGARSQLDRGRDGAPGVPGGADPGCAGRQVRTLATGVRGLQLHRIEVAPRSVGLQAGVYFVRASGPGQSARTKLVVRKVLVRPTWLTASIHFPRQGESTLAQQGQGTVLGASSGAEAGIVDARGDVTPAAVVTVPGDVIPAGRDHRPADEAAHFPPLNSPEIHRSTGGEVEPELGISRRWIGTPRELVSDLVAEDRLDRGRAVTELVHHDGREVARAGRFEEIEREVGHVDARLDRGYFHPLIRPFCGPGGIAVDR